MPKAKNDDEVHVIACIRTRKEGPSIPSDIVRCDLCNHTVYLSHSTPKIPSAKFRCMQCVDWDDIDDIIDPTPEQWENIGKIIKGTAQ